ncbi:MAG TPA: hypothetical protein VFP84_24850 [Kofleriaceae bacterium]|nr:hypothetical protein [Kofleriaceae bacterium]
MRRGAALLAWLSVLVIGLVIGLAVATPARAHVVASTGSNNRYLKLSVLGDRLRLAYTIFYGEVPGGALRKAIDANHDGAIDDSETQPLGDRVARDVAAAVELTVDGVRRPVVWSEVVVGMGSPRADAGAFSIDLVATICLAAPRGTHALLLKDAYAIDSPGETEVKLEDAPGVHIDRSHIGDADDEAHDYQLVGPSGALERHGLEAQVTVSPRAIATPDATCPGPAHARAVSTPLVLGGGVVLGFALLGAAGFVLRLRKRTAARPRHSGGKRR